MCVCACVCAHTCMCVHVFVLMVWCVGNLLCVYVCKNFEGVRMIPCLDYKSTRLCNNNNIILININVLIVNDSVKCEFIVLHTIV